MAKVTLLPEAGPLEGEELIPLVQDGELKAGNANAIASLATKLLSPFADPSVIDAALKRIATIDCYESVGGVALDWPPVFHMLEASRQATTDRVRLRVAKFTDNASTLLLRESVGGAGFIVVAGETGFQEYPLFANDASLGVPAGTEVARIRVDITGPFGAYVTPYAFAASELKRDQLFMSTASRQRIGELIEARLIEGGFLSESPFVPQVRNERMKTALPFIAGWNTQGGDLYGISTFELAEFSTFYRFQITIRNFTKGYDAAQGGLFVQKATGPDPRGQEHWLFIEQGTLPNYTGENFVIRLSADADWSVTTTETFTLYTQAGIRADFLADYNAVEEFVTSPPRADETVTIANSGGDATGLVAATAPFYNDNFNDTPGSGKFSVWPNSPTGYARRIGFEVTEDGFEEEVSGYCNLPFSILRGRGMFNTRFYNEDPTLRVFERTWSSIFIDFAAEQFANQYLEHNDNASGESRLSQVGDPVLKFRLFQAYIRVWYRAWGTDATAGAPSCIGQGTSAGQVQRFVSSLFEMGAPGAGPDIAAIFAHNSPNMAAGGRMSFEQGTIVRSNHPTRRSLQLIGSFGQPVPTEVYVDPSCTIENGIQGSILMVDNDPAMPARARDRWPFVVRGVVPDGVSLEDPKMRVLETDNGTTLTGSQAAIVALFGQRYDRATGRGEALTLDGSTQALATKLNGLAGSTVTLSRPGVANEVITIGTHTGQTEAQVLAALNAQLSNFAITAVRIDDTVAAETPTAV
jgi:hypothetical protein